MKTWQSAATVGALILLSGTASAASLLTSGVGYSGPTIDLTGYAGDYTFSAGPILLVDGTTYSSTNSASVLGRGFYGLGSNGNSLTTPIIGTNNPTTSTVTLMFSTPLSSFGGGFNYAPGYGPNPVIAAYDTFGNLIAAYDLAALAPISTPGAVDAFVFRGIDGRGVLIKTFTFGGSLIILAGQGVGPDPEPGVPEPASWLMMIVGFGLVGAVMRRKNIAVA